MRETSGTGGETGEMSGVTVGTSGGRGEASSDGGETSGEAIIDLYLSKVED